MTAMKAANKELKGMMKTVKLEDIDVSSILPSYQIPHASNIHTLLQTLLLIFPVCFCI
jgi:hypothetical protein